MNVNNPSAIGSLETCRILIRSKTVLAEHIHQGPS